MKSPAPRRSLGKPPSSLTPDVILTGGAAPLAELLQVTRQVPIVFAIVADAVGAG